MTIQKPETDDHDVALIAEELLNHLRTKPGSENASFVELPERLLGGYETLIYAFRLSGVEGSLEGPLVLRLLAESESIRQTNKEKVFQNAVADAGFPAPRVLFGGGEKTIRGRVFNVMERVSGHSMMVDLFTDPTQSADMANLLAQMHKELHAIDADQVAKAIETSGIALRAVSLDGELDNLERYVRDPALAHLEPGVAWLHKYQPAARDRVAVCHGDFHPGNVMIEAGQMMGILDWSAAHLADPEQDVAASLVLLTVVAPEIPSGLPPNLFAEFAGQYLDAYALLGTLDASRLVYYRALRAMHAFLRAHAARTPGTNPGLLPRDEYPWAREGAVRRLVGVIQETTDIDLPLPS
jgi:aminoglycoside phosphotransferase (APT) family kinase protein